MSKKAITIIASEKTYNNLISFNTIDELNETVRYYKEHFKTNLSKSAIRVLDQLQRYSCKYLGVSFRSKGNIAKTLNISRRTVIRACQLLERLGIIKQYEMKRKSDMQQTSSAIVIQSITTKMEGSANTVTQDSPKMSHEDKPILKQNIKDINTRTNDVAKTVRCRTYQPSFIPDWVTKSYPELIKYALYFYQPEQVTEFARVVLIQSKKYSIDSKSVSEVSVDAFKQLICKVKTKSIKNPFAYYTSILKRKLKGLMVRSMFLNVFDA